MSPDRPIRQPSERELRNKRTLQYLKDFHASIDPDKIISTASLMAVFNRTAGSIQRLIQDAGIHREGRMWTDTAHIIEDIETEHGAGKIVARADHKGIHFGFNPKMVEEQDHFFFTLDFEGSKDDRVERVEVVDGKIMLIITGDRRMSDKKIEIIEREFPLTDGAARRAAPYYMQAIGDFLALPQLQIFA